MLFGKKNIEPVQSKNAFRPKVVEPVVEEKTVKKEKPVIEKQGPSFEYNFVKSLSGIMDGSFLTKESVRKLIPYFIFIIFLAVLLISNNYLAQRRIKEIDVTTQEIKELHNEYISIKSELMYKSKMSEVANKLELLGVKESTVPPKKIIVEPKNQDNE